MSEIITPNQARTLRKALRACFADARAQIEKARALRATGKSWDAEDAEGELVYASLYHDDARKILRKLANAQVVKWSSYAPNTAARLQRRQ